MTNNQQDKWSLFIQKTGDIGNLVWKGALGLIAIAAIVIIFIQLLPGGTLLNKLSDPEIVRGFITFIIAIVTVAIAIILVIGAFYINGDGSDKTSLKERFGMAKEVLTALIGILGTIVGFYFGSIPAKPPAQALKVTEGKVVDQTKAFPGGALTISFRVTGGKAPYDYTVTFRDNIIPPFSERAPKSGVITKEIKIPDKVAPGSDLNPIKIEVTDNEKKSANFEIKEPIKVKARPAARWLSPATPLVLHG